MENEQKESFDILDTLVLHKKLSPSGRNWLLSALDPFHDYQHDISGYPDADGGLSTVQSYVASAQVSKPSGTTGTWDCQVVNLPFMMTNEASNGTDGPKISDGVLYADGSISLDQTQDTGKHWQPIMIVSADSGDDLWVTTSGNWTVAGLDLQEQALKAKTGRIIALAYEVHNTTAEIYRQGNVTVNEISANPEFEDYTMIDSNALTWNTRSTYYGFRMPPGTVTNAVKYPNALTWEARRGVYAIPTMTSNDNRVHMPHSANICARKHGDVPGDSSGIIMTNPSATIATTPADLSASTKSQAWVAPSNFNMVASTFSGLSEETTLMVTVKALIEYFPYFGNQFLPNATPSPALDSYALRLYSEVARQKPVAVFVDMNSKGSYYRMIGSKLLRAVGEVAPILGGIADIFIPGTAAVGAGVGAAAMAGSSIVRPKTKRKKKVPAKQRFIK